MFVKNSDRLIWWWDDSNQEGLFSLGTNIIIVDNFQRGQKRESLIFAFMCETWIMVLFGKCLATLVVLR
jgi:hypothetical protein